jgi:hypothetical protein
MTIHVDVELVESDCGRRQSAAAPTDVQLGIWLRAEELAATVDQIVIALEKVVSSHFVELPGHTHIFDERSVRIAAPDCAPDGDAELYACGQARKGPSSRTKRDLQIL